MKKNNRNSGKAVDGSLEIDRHIGSRRMSPGKRQVLSPMNMQIGSSETEGCKMYTKQEVEMLLKDRFKGAKFDLKGKQEWTTDYIKRLKTCLKWSQDVVDESGLQTALESQEKVFKVMVSKLETNILSLNESLAKEESEKLAALDCLKKEREAKMAIEKDRDSLSKELGRAEQNVLNANEKVIMQEKIYASLQEYDTQLQDELREANRANEQLESEKAAILQELSTLRAHYTIHDQLNLVVLNPDDASLEMDRNIGSRTTPCRRQVLSPTNMQIGSSETEEFKMYTKEEVEILLKDRFKGRKCDHKGKQEWMIEYVKRLKVCLQWLEDGVDEKDGLCKMLDSSERINKPDPFSLLQDDILLDIMSRLECTTKELIRTTSSISKRWKNLWASVPHLIFHELEDNVDTRTNIQPYISFINNTINKCPAPTYPNLKLFKLHTNYDSELNPEFKSRVNSWIHYAIDRNVEEFDLRVCDMGRKGDFTYNDELFFDSTCITRITLTWCQFNPPNEVIRWKGLESLCITFGTLDEDMLEKILSGSPCLETLKLNNCYGYRRINITSKSVKAFVFSEYNSSDEIDRDEDYIDCVNINAPYISSLTIEGDLVLRELTLLNVSSLVEADLDYWMKWSGISHEEILRGLLESLKHVKDIAFGEDVWELHSRLEASSDMSSDDQEDESD